MAPHSHLRPTKADWRAASTMSWTVGRIPSISWQSTRFIREFRELDLEQGTEYG